jgi:hypothetical protein
MLRCFYQYKIKTVHNMNNWDEVKVETEKSN